MANNAVVADRVAGTFRIFRIPCISSRQVLVAFCATLRRITPLSEN